MDNNSPVANESVYAERFEQAIRVMESLSEAERRLFSLNVWAVEREDGVSACIAGHCGRDPWFQAQGFVTTIGDGDGSVNCSLFEFFGNDRPFYKSHYRSYDDKRDITVDEAIAALKQAMSAFNRTSETVRVSAA